MSSKKPPKKLVVVRGDILAKVARIANREGKTITTFANEVFEQAIKVYEMGLTLPEVVELYMLTKISREGGGSVVPRDILRYLISKVYRSDRDELTRRFYEAGSWFGKYIVARVHDRDPLEFLERLLYANVWDVKEVYVGKSGGKLSVRCVAPQLSEEETRLLASYIEGLVSALGFKPAKNDIIRGIILLDFEGGGESEGSHGEEGSLIREGQE